MHSIEKTLLSRSQKFSSSFIDLKTLSKQISYNDSLYKVTTTYKPSFLSTEITSIGTYGVAFTGYLRYLDLSSYISRISVSTSHYRTSQMFIDMDDTRKIDTLVNTHHKAAKVQIQELLQTISSMIELFKQECPTVLVIPDYILFLYAQRGKIPNNTYRFFRFLEIYSNAVSTGTPDQIKGAYFYGLERFKELSEHECYESIGITYFGDTTRTTNGNILLRASTYPLKRIYVKDPRSIPEMMLDDENLCTYLPTDDTYYVYSGNDISIKYWSEAGYYDLLRYLYYSDSDSEETVARSFSIMFSSNKTALPMRNLFYGVPESLDISPGIDKFYSYFDTLTNYINEMTTQHDRIQQCLQKNLLHNVYSMFLDPLSRPYYEAVNNFRQEDDRIIIPNETDILIDSVLAQPITDVTKAITKNEKYNLDNQGSPIVPVKNNKVNFDMTKNTTLLIPADNKGIKPGKSNTQPEQRSTLNSVSDDVFPNTTEIKVEPPIDTASAIPKTRTYVPRKKPPPKGDFRVINPPITGSYDGVLNTFGQMITTSIVTMPIFQECYPKKIPNAIVSDELATAILFQLDRLGIVTDPLFIDYRVFDSMTLSARNDITRFLVPISFWPYCVTLPDASYTQNINHASSVAVGFKYYERKMGNTLLTTDFINQMFAKVAPTVSEFGHRRADHKFSFYDYVGGITCYSYPIEQNKLYSTFETTNPSTIFPVYGAGTQTVSMDEVINLVYYYGNTGDYANMPKSHILKMRPSTDRYPVYNVLKNKTDITPLVFSMLATTGFVPDLPYIVEGGIEPNKWFENANNAWSIAFISHLQDIRPDLRWDSANPPIVYALDRFAERLVKALATIEDSKRTLPNKAFRYLLHMMSWFMCSNFHKSANASTIAREINPNVYIFSSVEQVVVDFFTLCGFDKIKYMSSTATTSTIPTNIAESDFITPSLVIMDYVYDHNATGGKSPSNTVLRAVKRNCGNGTVTFYITTDVPWDRLSNSTVTYNSQRSKGQIKVYEMISPLRETPFEHTYVFNESGTFVSAFIPNGASPFHSSIDDVYDTYHSLPLGRGVEVIDAYCTPATDNYSYLSTIYEVQTLVRLLSISGFAKIASRNNERTSFNVTGIISGYSNFQSVNPFGVKEISQQDVNLLPISDHTLAKSARIPIQENTYYSYRVCCLIEKNILASLVELLPTDRQDVVLIDYCMPSKFKFWSPVFLKTLASMKVTLISTDPATSGSKYCVDPVLLDPDTLYPRTSPSATTTFDPLNQINQGPKFEEFIHTVCDNAAVLTKRDKDHYRPLIILRECMSMYFRGVAYQPEFSSLYGINVEDDPLRKQHDFKYVANKWPIVFDLIVAIIDYPMPTIFNSYFTFYNSTYEFVVMDETNNSQGKVVTRNPYMRFSAADTIGMSARHNVTNDRQHSMDLVGPLCALYFSNYYLTKVTSNIVDKIMAMTYLF